MENAAVFMIGRDIVVSSAEAIKKELKDAIDGSAGDFTVDLTGVEMIDSRGLGLLIAAFNSLDEAGRKFRVVKAIPDIVELFKIMRLNRHFSVE